MSLLILFGGGTQQVVASQAVVATYVPTAAVVATVAGAS